MPLHVIDVHERLRNRAKKQKKKKNQFAQSRSVAHHSMRWEALCLLIGYPREASVLPLGRFQSCDFVEGCIIYFQKYKILLFDGQS